MGYPSGRVALWLLLKKVAAVQKLSDHNLKPFSPLNEVIGID